jgi:hypothetical protein
MKLRLTALAFLLTSATLTGCSVNSDALDQKEKKDAKRTPEENIDNSAPARVVNMPNGFSNITMKCDGGGNMIYATSRGTSGEPSRITIVKDSRC